MRAVFLVEQGWAFAATLGVVLLLPGASAYADTRVVTEVVVTGLPQRPQGTGQPGSPLTVTTYYKGDRARVEVAGGAVTLYDPKADKVYQIDPVRKTYRFTTVKQAPDTSAVLRAARALGGPTGGSRAGVRPEGAGPGGERAEGPGAGGDRAEGAERPGGGEEVPGGMRRMANIKLETSVKVKAEKEHKTLDGRDARRYTFTGTETLTREVSGGPGGFGGGRRGGGFPGGGFPGGRRGGYGRGGGFPGGGFPGGGYPGGGRGGGRGGRGSGEGRGGMQRALPSFQVEGEYWFSEAVTGVDTGTKKSMALLPILAQSLPDNPAARAFLKPLMDRLAKAKAKGFPVASRVTLTLRRPSSPQASPDDAPKPVVVTTELRSVTEAPLDDALFRVPDDYKQIDSTAVPPAPALDERRP